MREKYTKETHGTEHKERARCDLCTTNTESNISFCGTKTIMTCEVCGKDVCRECRHLTYGFGDYQEGCYCIDCWIVGNKYIKLIEGLTEKFDTDEEKILKTWREEGKLLWQKKLLKQISKIV